MPVCETRPGSLPNLLHFYKLNEPLGATSVLDSVGSNNGTPTNVTFGEAGGAGDGQTSTLIGTAGRIQINAILLPAGSATIEALIYWDGIGQGAFIGSASIFTGFSLGIDTSGHFTFLQPGGAVGQTYVTDYALSANEWHLVRWEYESVFPAYPQRWYVDDVLVETRSQSTNPQATAITYLGFYGVHNWPGKLQNIAIYDGVPQSPVAFTSQIRSVAAALAAALLTKVTTLCVCVKLVRKDTATLGFTTHDEDLTFDALTYEALSSVQATALRQQVGSGIDNMEILGLLSSDKITEDDLRAQRYDSAEVFLYIVDWVTLTSRLLVLRGTLGEITLTDGQYRAEVRSLMQRFTQQVGPLTSPTCRWKRFGDSHCTKAIGPLTFPATLESIGSVPRLFLATLDAGAAWPLVAGQNGFNYGVARATSGDNMGLEREIKRVTGSGGTGVARTFELMDAFPFPLLPLDTFAMEQGCDRRKLTCIAYANMVNFGGEPDVPGTDKITSIGRHNS